MTGKEYEWRINFNKDGVRIFKNIVSPINLQYRETEVEKIAYNELDKLKNLNTVIMKIEPEIDNGILKSLSVFASTFEQLQVAPSALRAFDAGDVEDVEQLLLFGEDKKIWRSYRDILVITAIWLYENGRLQKKDIPIYDASQGKRYLLNIIPKHAYGKDFYSLEKIDEGVYLHTNYSASDCIRNANFLMGKFASDIEFRILGNR